MFRRFRVRVDGKDYMVDVEEINADHIPAAAPAPVPTQKVEASKPQVSVEAPKPQPKQETKPAAPAQTGGKTIVAPMSGTILDIFVSQGVEVKKDQRVLILEAMKMENAILSEYDGKVVEVKVNKGDSVEAGDVLAVIA